MEHLEKIRGLKKDVGSVRDMHYNKAIDDVIGIITGKKPTYPETACVDCGNCFIFDDDIYFCEARDDLGGEGGGFELDQIKETYPCESFRKKQLIDRNKIGTSTCPKCGKEHVFYWFNDVYHSDGMPGMNPTWCPSCKVIIFNPKSKMTFARDDEKKKT